MKDVCFLWFKIYLFLNEKYFVTLEVELTFATLLQPHQVLEGHTDEIFSCAFNYEGNIIITGNTDHSSNAVMSSVDVIFHVYVTSVSFWVFLALFFLSAVFTG